MRSGRTAAERNAGGPVVERLDLAPALHVRLEPDALRRRRELLDLALVDAGRLVDLEPRVAPGRRDEGVGHAGPRDRDRAQVFARLQRGEQRVRDVVVVDHEQTFDELLGVGGDAIAHADLGVLAEHLHAVLRRELHLDVDHRAVEALPRVVRDLGGLAPEHVRDARPLVGGEHLQELHLGEPLAGRHVRHLHHEAVVVPGCPHGILRGPIHLIGGPGRMPQPAGLGWRASPPEDPP